MDVGVFHPPVLGDLRSHWLLVPSDLEACYGVSDTLLQGSGGEAYPLPLTLLFAVLLYKSTCGQEKTADGTCSPGD